MRKILLILFILPIVVKAELPIWSYDSGPDPKTKLGKELIDITAQIPNMPELSKKILGKKQKFRPAFGPIPWRMIPGENKVKILFMGQDGTHIAEAAGRPATAGFGGRAQDLANYFGVNEGAAFINAYSFTIKGQYGVYNTPYFEKKNDDYYLRFGNLVDNKLWLLSNDLSSPVVQWRNSLVDWIIRNNRDSLKLIVLFGGASRDAIASYALSKGADVKAFNDKKELLVPMTKEEYAGGNNTFPSLVSKSGKDLYKENLGYDLDYKNKKDQKKIIKFLKENYKQIFSQIAFSKAGPEKSGLLSKAQISGYNLNEMYLNGVKTRSLKGIVLNDGTTLDEDVLVVELPHPSSLSRTVMDASSYSAGKKAASDRVMSRVKALDKYADKGWMIKPDHGKVNYYARGEKYNYGRSDIGPEFYDFGTPKNRMVSKSTARRMSGNPNVVIIGTRENGRFSKSQIKNLTNAKPNFNGLDSSDLYIARPRNIEQRYVFDSGPGAKYAKIMKENISNKAIFASKFLIECFRENKIIKALEVSSNKEAKDFNCPANSSKKMNKMSFKNNGINAYNVKSHPSVGDFGHYRGTFNSPRVVVLADPHGYDSILTAKALTGSRGQYLHSIFENSSIKDQYLVLKTVPFAMDEASSSEWQYVLDNTQKYRKTLFSEIFKDGQPDFVIADGNFASSVIDELIQKDIKVIKINRKGYDAKSGLSDLISELKQMNVLNKDFKLYQSNIPRNHLSFYARVWEGTSGDRVLTSAGKEFKGIAYAVVVPKWAYKHTVKLTKVWEVALNEMFSIIQYQNLRGPYEKLSTYFQRVDAN